MTEQYRKRVKGILETLGGLRLLYEQPVSHLYAAPGAYPLCTEFHKEMLDGWKPFASGETWGGGDTHWWFYGKVEIPAHYDGKKVILSLSTGATDIWNTDNPQIIAYVNGKMAATLDMNHTRIILSEKARAGEVYETAFYAYSNLSEKTNFFSLSQAVLDEKTEELYYDMKVLWEAADLLREDEEERIRIFEALNRCVNLLDLRETGSERFYASVEEADQFIKKEYERAEKKASDPAVVHSVGHTHIDVAWKWPLRQTRQKAVRSFLTVLNLMEQYPEYRFMSSQPQLYQYVKEEAPELYEQIKERVREGRWEPEGAMWVEADCNLSSGESLIRQLLHGKRFFQEEFGKGDNEVLWLPDVFGYSVALPQILRKSGIKYFMTTKIGWNEYNQIPNDTMMWRGLDGSEVLTYFITTSDYCTYPELRKKRNFSTTYNGLQNARQIMGTWQRYQNKALNQDVLTCYGYGDGGGGTTPEMLEESRRLESAPGKCPKVRQTSVKEFFHLLEKNLEGRQVPKWSGELYLEFHRGTYTSMARNKKENRKCEFLLAWAESLCVLACRQAPEFSYPDEELDRAWKLVLLNQFHDILPGSSIREVYEDSRVQYQEVHRILDAVIRRAEDAVFSAQGLERAESQTGNDTGNHTEEPAPAMLAVWNPLSFLRSGIVEIGGAAAGQAGLIQEDNGEKHSAYGQISEDGTLLVPVWDAAPKGLKIYEAPALLEKNGAVLSAGPEEFVLWNLQEQDGRIKGFDTAYYEIRLNENGELTSVFDKKRERQVLSAGQAGNRLLAFEDRPEEYDAWNIDAYYEEKQWVVEGLSECRVTENGPLRGCISIRRTFLKSVIEQQIYFYRHTGRIDFKTRIDWKESQILLKAAFPVDVLTDKAVYDVQFGNVERPTHRNTSWEQAKFEVCAHKWADVSEAGYGVALMNDCKYGYDIRESVMRLTLLKSGIFPNPTADQEVHTFTYSLYPHDGDFRTGGVVQEAYDLNCPLQAVPVREKTAEPGEGRAWNGENRSSAFCVAVDAENVLADTVKKAEDGDGITLRLYETYGKRTRTRVTVPASAGKQAEDCDCMEQPLGRLELEDGAISLEFRPYEIKTIRIR